MPIYSDDEHSAPVLMTCGELINQEEQYPTRRFPTPSDTYSDDNPLRGPSSVPRSPRSEASGALQKPRMEFVYPPKPRARARGQQGEDDGSEGEDENARGFSPGPSWLEKMLVDLELGRKDMIGDLEELKVEVQTVLYEIIRLRILLDREQAATKDFVNRMRRIVGDEMVNTIIAEATQAAEARTSDEEEDEEEEEVEGEHEGEQHGEDHEELDDHADDNYRKSKEEPRNAVDDNTLSFFDREIGGRYLDVMYPSVPHRKRSFEAFGDEEQDADDEGSPHRPIAGPSHKRLRTSPSPPKAQQTHKPLSPICAPPIATLETSSPSSSRKRNRPDDGEESEQEVENSVRLSMGLESSFETLQRSANKRFRCDVDGSSPEATISSPVLTLVRHPSLAYSSSESSASDDSRNVLDTSDEEGNTLVPFKEFPPLEEDDDDDESYVPSGDDDDDDALESDVAEDKLDLDPSVDEDRGDSHSNPEQELRKSLHFRIDEEGKGSWVWDTSRSRSPSIDIEDYFRYVEKLVDEPPSAEPLAIDSGPLRILGFGRPLKRTCERLRPTADGGAEVYKYNEGPEYEARLAKEAEVFAEWKKFESESAGHRMRGSLRETKGRRA